MAERRRKKGRTQTAFRLDAEAVQLEHDAEQLADWFHDVIGSEKFTTRDEFLDSLNTGTLLCDLMFKLFPDRKSKVFDDAEPGTFQARDNISKFLDACKALGLDESSLFTADDLVERGSDKAVFATLQLVKAKAPEVSAEEKASEAADAASAEDVDAGDAAAGGEEALPPTTVEEAEEQPAEEEPAVEEQPAEDEEEDDSEDSLEKAMAAAAYGQEEDDGEAEEPAAEEPAQEPAAEEPAAEPTTEETAEPSPAYEDMSPKCSFCAKELLGKKFKCGGCSKKVWYCDRTCQRKDWREHKKSCERRHKQ